MGQLLNSISPVVWIIAATVASIVLALELYPHLRFAWHGRRIARRLAEHSGVDALELRELQQQQGDEPTPLDVVDVACKVIGAAFLTGLPLALDEMGLEWAWPAAVAAVVVFSALRWLWRRLNNPPEFQPEPFFTYPQIAVPREAVQGFALAVAVVAALVGAGVFLL